MAPGVLPGSAGRAEPVLRGVVPGGEQRRPAGGGRVKGSGGGGGCGGCGGAAGGRIPRGDGRPPAVLWYCVRRRERNRDLAGGAHLANALNE